MFKRYRAEAIFFILILFCVYIFLKNDFQNKRISSYLKEKKQSYIVDTLWKGALRAELKSLVDRKYKLGFNGAIAVQIGDEFRYEGRCGYSNYSLQQKIQSNTRFQIGSISKQFTSVAVLQLYAKNELRLTDSISKYFPDLHFKGFTIHDLLVHRSGISNYIYFIDKIVSDKNIIITNKDVLQLWNLHKPSAYFPPRKRFDYSNSGYMLLASIIEKVSGMSYPEYLQAYIFDPLQMTETAVCIGNCDSILNAAKGYSNRWHVITEPYLNGTYGDKGIYTSVRDILKWDQGLYKGEILHLDTLDLAFYPMGKPQSFSNNYGYGWRITKRKGVDIFYHAGWWQGFKSILIRIPDYKTSIVALKNTKVGVMFGREELLHLVIDKYLETQEDYFTLNLPPFQWCIMPDNIL